MTEKHNEEKPRTFTEDQGPLDLLRRLAPSRPVLKIEPDLSRIFFLEPERFQDDGDSSVPGRRPPAVLSYGSVG